MKNEQLLKKVDRYTEVPMLVLVLVMIITLVVPMVVTVPDATHAFLELVDWIIWSLFALELLVKTYLSQNKLRYLKSHWVDVLVVVLPLLRVFRIFRVARLARGARIFRALRFARVLVLFGRFTTEVKTIFTRHGFNYLLIVFIGVIVLGTVMTYQFDQMAQTGADTLTESLWLTVVNAFSGGFANVYPETPEAKAVSIVLITVGTVIVSYFTASLASYFTEKEQDVEQERIEKKLDSLITKINKLKRI